MTQQPMSQPMPPSYAPRPFVPKGMSIAGMVLGILSVVFFWLPFVGLVLGILGTALGGAGIHKANTGQGGGKGMAITGLACGIIGLVFGALLTIGLVLGAAWLEEMTGFDMS